MTALVYLAVFLSGAAALVYEVIWARQLATFLGITSYAQAAVLSSYMLGLALGSRVLGAWSDGRDKPLRLFGWLEAGIGIYAAATLVLVPRLQATYATWAVGSDVGAPSGYVQRFAIALIVLLLPTFLMGGTLPVLVRGLAHLSSPSVLLSRLYGLNTLGAAAGAVLAGFVLLPSLGMRLSVLAAASANLLIGAIFLAAGSRQTAKTESLDVPPPPRLPTLSADHRSLMLLLFALSGCAALALQVLWTRALSLVLGSSVYAFSIVLGIYLVGIALGSLLFSRHRPESASALLRLGARLEGALAATILLGLAVLPHLPQLFVGAYSAGLVQDFFRQQLVAAALSASILLPPTLLLGALFPLFVALLRSPDQSTGHSVGTALSANSVGTFLGAPLAVAVLLPWLGIGNGLLLLATVHLGLAMTLSALAHQEGLPENSGRPGGVWRWVLVAGLLCAVAVVVRWDRATMSSGPFINAFRLADRPNERSFRSWLQERNRLLYYQDGADATVAVREEGEERLLVINGKTDGSRLGDRRTQAALGHLPMLMHPNPDRALVIGLGTGITAAAAALHDDLTSLDIIEVSAGVIAASAFFDDDSRGVLFDPRTRLIRADARNQLLSGDRLYDVLISEPSNPWITGVANLFTREFFELARSRLARGGLMAQWFHVYGMSNDDLRSVLGTFTDVFPEVSVWLPQTGDLVLIGGEQAGALDARRYERLIRAPAARADLGPAELLSFSEFTRMYLLGTKDVRRYAGDAPRNTDDRPRVEFNAPRHLYAETTLANLGDFVAHRQPARQLVPIRNLLSHRPETERASAFGVDVPDPENQSARAQWHTTWTRLEAAGAGLQPTFAVSQERSVLFTSSTGDAVEIMVSPRSGNGAPIDLARHLDSRLPGSDLAATVPLVGELADGTPIVFARSRDQGGDLLGLAWSCSPAGRIYTLLVPLRGAGENSSAAERAGQLAQQLSCSRDPARLALD